MSPAEEPMSPAEETMSPAEEPTSPEEEPTSPEEELMSPAEEAPSFFFFKHENFHKCLGGKLLSWPHVLACLASILLNTQWELLETLEKERRK